MAFTHILQYRPGEGSNDSWILVWDEANGQTATGVEIDSNGNAIIAGEYSIYPSGADLLTLKVDTTGNTQWQRKWGDTTAAVQERFGLTDIGIDSSDNVYITGWQDQDLAATVDYYIITAKYNSAGVIQWQRQLGNTQDLQGTGAATMPDGTTYVCGIYDHVSLWPQGIIAKYNSAGVVQWQRTYGDGGSTPVRFDSIDVDSSGNVYMTGMQGFTSDNKIVIVKYDSSGTLQWQRFYNVTSSTDEGTAIAVSPAGSVYVVGFTTASGGEGGSDMVIIKCNTSGVNQWQRRIGTASSESPAGIALDSSENVYITGSINVVANTAPIIKYDSSGTLQWQRKLSTPSTDEVGGGIAVDNSGYYRLVGRTYHFSQGDNLPADMFLAYFPTDGTGTGTYGDFTYGTNDLVENAITMTNSAGNLTSGLANFPDVSASITEVATTFVGTKYVKT